MFHSVKKIFGYKIHGTDGDFGEVRDLYFDDAAWETRYLTVDTGRWLPGREVLISPVSAGKPDWSNHALPVSLTKSQVENSPPIEAAKPVDRQYEEKLTEHFGWPVYWLHYPAVPAGVLPAAQTGSARALGKSEASLRAEGFEGNGDPHLRSAREVSGYHIQASDGEIGHVEDFIAETDNWKIRYLVVDTRNWLPGRKVLVAPDWIRSVDWGQRKVFVNLRKEEIKNSPEFDPSRPVNKEYEAKLYDYYGRPKYW